MLTNCGAQEDSWESSSRPHEEEAETAVMAAASHQAPGTTRSRKRHRRTPCRRFRRSTAPPAPWGWTSSLQSCEKLVASSHPDCRTLLWQPQERNTVPFTQIHQLSLLSPIFAFSFSLLFFLNFFKVSIGIM